MDYKIVIKAIDTYKSTVHKGKTLTQYICYHMADSTLIQADIIYDKSIVDSIIKQYNTINYERN